MCESTIGSPLFFKFKTCYAFFDNSRVETPLSGASTRRIKSFASNLVFMSDLLSAVEFIKINPPIAGEDDLEWLNRQVILAQGNSARISTGIDLLLSVKFLAATDNVCERLVWEIDEKNSILISNHSPEEIIWPTGITLPPEILFAKSKKQIPQLEINLSEVWGNTSGEFFERLQKSADFLKTELKPAFIVTIIADEKEKHLALLVIHAYLHKSKTLRLIFKGENFKIW